MGPLRLSMKVMQRVVSRSHLHRARVRGHRFQVLALQRRHEFRAVLDVCYGSEAPSAGGQDRDLALFNLALDSKLRGCDLVSLRDRDVFQGNARREPRDGYVAEDAETRKIRAL
jgi:hypothetical protein